MDAKGSMVLDALRGSFLAGLFRLLGVGDAWRRVALAEGTPTTQAARRAGLAALLERADRTVPLFRGRYAPMLAEVRSAPDEAFFAAFARLPVLEKTECRAAGLGAMDERAARLASVELELTGRLAQDLRRLRAGGWTVSMATGGTTGEPLRVRFTKEHAFALLFSFAACWRAMGWRLGQRVLVFYPRGTYDLEHFVRLDPWARLLGFRFVLFDALDDAAAASLADALTSYRPRLLVVFPSTLNAVAQRLRRQGRRLPFVPPLVDASGEVLLDCQRASIAEVFPGCRVEDSYGSVELGEVAHERPGGGLQVFPHLAFLEAVPSEGGRTELLATSLASSDAPFVRYRTGDVADVRADGPDGPSVLRRLEGKRDAWLTVPGGGRLFPSDVNALINDANADAAACGALVEVRARERSPGDVLVEVMVREEAAGRRAALALERRLAARLGPGVRVAVVEAMAHDYRRKFKVLARPGPAEWAGGAMPGA